MNFREATEEDIPGVIFLLKMSLGEGLMPKSEGLWRWKHVDNPFGASPVWLAEEDGMIVGVRAFMRWKYTDGNKVYNALRAVDTATHPLYQGKGIFKRLTLDLVQASKEAGEDFIYNTPNPKSKKGYLKMGWKEKGRLPLRIKMLKPLEMAEAVLKRKKIKHSVQINHDWSGIPELITEQHSNTFSTLISRDYIQWRYVDCPLFPYGYASDRKTYLLIFRIKHYAHFRELRITEILQLNTDIPLDRYHLQDSISQMEKDYRVHFTTYSGLNHEHVPLRGWNYIPGMAVGPMITLRDLNMREDFGKLFGKKAVNFSLGDLEVF